MDIELTLGERAALQLIVKSGRLAVPAYHLNTCGSDGRIVAPYGHPSKGWRLQRIPESEAVPVDATTAEGLRDRGLVALWAVGVVVVYNRDEKRRLAVKQVVATLTPLSAELMGTRIIEKGRDETPRWGEDGQESDEPVARRRESKYPEPFAELVAPPDEGKQRRKGRRAG